MHRKELQEIPALHPMMYKEFLLGKFTVRKTARQFSDIGLDHGHEQENKDLKGHAGVIGLTHNDDTLHNGLSLVLNVHE